MKFGGTATKAYPHHTPAGKAMFGMTSVFAEFETDIIKERVKAGLARARAAGKRLGRQPISEAVVAQIREQLATGAGILKTAKELGCGTGTVHRVKRSMAALRSSRLSVGVCTKRAVAAKATMPMRVSLG